MKKVLTVLLVVALILSFAGCKKDDEASYKIGIITGTTSQGEEEYEAAQKMVEKYGADMIVTDTYPDNFSTETETTISRVVAMASDPDVKVIVFCQAVPGATAAIEKVRETRDDILFICGVCAEDPGVIAAAADICFLVDEITMGTTIIDQAAKMGAKTFVHVSFARHLGYSTIAQRRALFIQNCEAKGITYVEATAPDPTGDAGVSGAQQWIVENIPLFVDQYGKDTAFFCTNCSMQEPLILAVAQQGAIYPQQCCPSPYHGYPAAFSIDTTGHEGDVDWMLETIKGKVTEYGNSGRMSTWGVSVNMAMIEVGVEYGIKYCEGEVETNDMEAIKALWQQIASEEAALSCYSDDAVGTLDNFYMILCPFYDF